MVMGVLYSCRRHPLDCILRHICKAISTFVRFISLRRNPLLHESGALLHVENDDTSEETFMKTIIGQMAGRVWKTLGEKEEVAVAKLPQILREKGEIVFQALGWLAREGKIDFHKKEGKTFVSLNHEEQEMCKKSP